MHQIYPQSQLGLPILVVNTVCDGTLDIMWCLPSTNLVKLFVYPIAVLRSFPILSMFVFYRHRKDPSFALMGHTGIVREGINHNLSIQFLRETEMSNCLAEKEPTLGV